MSDTGPRALCVTVAELVADIKAGDWGYGEPADGRFPVVCLRGTDFEDASHGLLANAPLRYLTQRRLQARELNPGDLLVEMSGGSRDQATGRALLVTDELLGQSQQPVCYSNFVKRVRFDSRRVDPEFAWRQWQHLYRRGRTRIYERRTTGIRNFKLDSFLTNEVFWVPPLPEQRAIARVLRTVQRAKEATEQVIAAARELKKSLMRHLFVEEWPLRRLGDVIEKPQYGYTESAREDRVGPRFLRITDIQNGGVNWPSVPFCECEPKDLGKYALEPGDVVVARIGATTGKAFYVADVPKPAVFASYLIRLRTRPGLAARYLGYFTESEAYWHQINTEKGGRLKTGVNARTLADLRIPLPSLRDQVALVRDLEAVDGKIAAEEAYRDALATLFDSLLHDLMTAKFRVTDLIEEVA